MVKDVETNPQDRPNKFSKLHNFTSGPPLSAEDFGRMKTISSVSVTIPDSEVKIKHVASATSVDEGDVLFLLSQLGLIIFPCWEGGGTFNGQQILCF